MNAALNCRGPFARGTIPGRAASACAAVSLLSCTLDNSVVDDPARDVPANAFRDSPSERSEELWREPGENLLAALAEIEASDGASVQPAFNRVLGTVLSEAGAYFSALANYQPFGNPFSAQTDQCENSELPDAIEELCASIQGREPDPDVPEDDGRLPLVLINDLPHGAFYRTVMRKLLGCAAEAGFNYLAVEALAEDDAALEARGYVSRSESGDLTREPQLARLIEEAMALGFDIVSYDVAGRCTDCGILEAINQHSAEQAANLVAKTFDVDPEAKVLVLAGARQSYKRMWGPDPPFTTSLGSHLWEQTGFEPYSVDQIAVNLPARPFGNSSPEPPSGMYLAGGPDNGSCMGSYTPESPTGLGTLDSVVVHVPPRVDAERWDWLHAPADERRTITPACEACSENQRLLVQAFPASVDPADRVPVDQALCTAGASCQMVLPPGAYQVIVWSEESRIGAMQVDLSADSAASVSF